MSVPLLGLTADRGRIEIDVETLVKTRALLTANSGAGKSWALRRILEQTHGKIQHLVIDPEGEFYTLRDKFDYVLAGKGGDCDASPRSAAMLARKLLELKASAILDLYELKPHDRILFVRRFLESLIDAPKDLWHDVLVPIDEAHAFAPEGGHGSAESSEAVARLMSQGRKRGFCGILSTQRISKLSKDVAAEANNLIIGRCALDVDLRRAGDILGLSKTDAFAKLPRLAPGHFYVVGPALSQTVAEVEVGGVQTSHPKGGTAQTKPAMPRGKVLAVLSQLGDLPKEAEVEARTVAELQAKIRALEAEAKKRPVQLQPVETIKEVSVLADEDRAILTKWMESFRGDIGDRLASVQHALKENVDQIQKDREAVERILNILNNHAVVARTPYRATQAPQSKVRMNGAPPVRTGVVARASAPVSDGARLPEGEKAILIACAQHEPEGCDRVQLSILTGYKRSTRDAYIARLSGKGFVVFGGSGVQVTDEGYAALGSDYEPLPTGDKLREWWLQKLPEGESAILSILCQSHPEGTSRDYIGENTGFKRSTRDAYLSRLAAKKLVVPASAGMVRASDILFS